MNEHIFLPQPLTTPHAGYPIGLGRIHSEPGHSVSGRVYPIHTYNVHLIAAGQGYIHTPSGRVCLKAGQGFLYGGDELQDFKADPDDPWDVWWIYFRGEGVQHVLGESGLRSGWTFQHREPERLIRRLRDLWAFAEMRDFRQIPAIAAGMYELLLELRMHADRLSRGTTLSLTTDEKIRRTAEYMRLHCQQTLPLPELADRSGISVWYLSRRFHELVGMTPTDYVHRHRIEMAKQMLIATSMTVKQIAFEVGYTRPSYFIERFRELEHRTPTQYRKRYI